MDFKNDKGVGNVLLVIVILVFGVVGYQFFGYFYPDKVETSKIIISNFKAPIIKKKDIFSLLPTDTDPFLGTIYKNPNKISKIKSKLKSSTPWPTINYFGIVSDKNASSSVYIVSINGKQHLLKKGDTIQKIKVIRGSNEAISIKYAGVTKEFTLM